eukprot:scaffold1149_cov236-Pinguiococcus_pyrenoidosus.AAC.4
MEQTRKGRTQRGLPRCRRWGARRCRALSAPLRPPASSPAPHRRRGSAQGPCRGSPARDPTRRPARTTPQARRSTRMQCVVLVRFSSSSTVQGRPRRLLSRQEYSNKAPQRSSSRHRVPCTAKGAEQDGYDVGSPGPIQRPSPRGSSASLPAAST